MKRTPKASIIIPTYNRAKYLDLTLQSISQQRCDFSDLETIVVDDGSSDHTLDICQKYQREFDLKYLFQDDLGNRTAEARNLGILNSTGKILIFIDSGVILDPTCVQEHIEIHSKFSKEIAVIGYVFGFDQNCAAPDELKSVININSIDETVNSLKQLNKFSDMRDNLYKKITYQVNSLPAPWALFITCNCSVKKITLDKVGLFDTNLDLNWGVEDLELGYRLWEQNVCFVLGTNAIAIHYPHESNMGQKFEEEIENKRYLNRKHNSLATKLFLDCGFLELNQKILDIYCISSK